MRKMGFLDWFRKKQEEEIVETATISQGEISTWLEKKEQETEKQKQEFLEIVKNNLNKLVSELEEEVDVLKEVDVDEKKAEEKIKLIVKENLGNFINYLEKLILKLKEVNGEVEITENINSIFSEFDKRSKLSYEKSTFLIGKELGNVQESIRKFFKELKKISDSNKNLIDELRVISSVETKIGEQEEIAKIKVQLEDRIQELGEKIKTKQEELEKLKTSKEFLKENQRKQALETKGQELEQDIGKLRELVDFKALSGFYHKFEKDMAIVRDYRDNFKQAFKKTNGEDLNKLLEESKLGEVVILNKMQEISEKKKEINELVKEKASSTGETIKKLVLNIHNLNSEKSNEKKKAEKIENNLKEVVNSTKEELKKVNVELKE